MMKYNLIIIVIVISLVSIQSVQAAGNSITGTITDNSGRAAMIRVDLVNGQNIYTAKSDYSTGSYSLNVPSGTYDLQISDVPSYCTGGVVPGSRGQESTPKVCYDSTNLPFFLEVHKTVTISNSATFSLTLPVSTISGSGLPFSGKADFHIPFSISGWTGYSGDRVDVTNGAFTIKSLPVQNGYKVYVSKNDSGVTAICTVSGGSIVC